MDNVAKMSSQLAAEHKMISDKIYKAMGKGDVASMELAGKALLEHVQKAQIATKIVAKAATGLETLTRLQ
jgi:hypothetical protein